MSVSSLVYNNSDHTKDIFDRIVEKIHEIAESEYMIYSYVPKKRNIEIKPQQEREDHTEINRMKSQIYRMILKKNQRCRLMPYVDIAPTNVEKQLEKIKMKEVAPVVSQELQISSNSFNIVTEIGKDWRQLEKKDKLIALEKFVSSESTKQKYGVLPDDILSALRDMVESGNLLYKKDIQYDPINMVIVDIPLINNEGDAISLAPVDKKINIRRHNKTTIKKLIRKV